MATVAWWKQVVQTGLSEGGTTQDVGFPDDWDSSSDVAYLTKLIIQHEATNDFVLTLHTTGSFPNPALAGTYYQIDVPAGFGPYVIDFYLLPALTKGWCQWSVDQGVGACTIIMNMKVVRDKMNADIALTTFGTAVFDVELELVD